jgi:hypothetical protein
MNALQNIEYIFYYEYNSTDTHSTDSTNWTDSII